MLHKTSGVFPVCQHMLQLLAIRQFQFELLMWKELYFLGYLWDTCFSILLIYLEKKFKYSYIGSLEKQ